MDAFNMSQSNITTTSTSISYISLGLSGLILSLLVSLPENVYVIWLIITGAGNGVASEFFSLNMSICEILLCLQCFLTFLSNACPSLLLVVVFLKGIPIAGRPVFQCLICVDCYLAVVHPLTFLKLKPLRYRLICCAVVWIIILIYCVCVLKADTDYSFIWFCMIQGWLTMCVKLFCCLAVVRALKRSGPGERGKERERENYMKRKAFHNILLIMMAILVIYSAYSVAALVYILSNLFIPELWLAGEVCFWLGGLVQPLLYLHRTGKLNFCRAL